MALRALERRIFGEELTPTAREQFLRAGKLAAAVLIPILVLGIMIPTGAALYLVDRRADQESQRRIEEVNNSRAEVTYTTCLAQNDRHDRTIDQLDILIERQRAPIRKQIMSPATGPAEEAVLRARLDALDAGRNSTRSLIDALAPFQNCEQLVIDRFGFIPDLAESTKASSSIVREEA